MLHLLNILVVSLRAPFWVLLFCALTASLWPNDHLSFSCRWPFFALHLHEKNLTSEFSIVFSTFFRFLSFIGEKKTDLWCTPRRNSGSSGSFLPFTYNLKFQGFVNKKYIFFYCFTFFSSPITRS